MKIELTLKADNKTSNTNTSNVRLIEPAPDVKNAQGQTTRAATTVLQLAFADPEKAEPFKINKQYRVTIEEI